MNYQDLLETDCALYLDQLKEHDGNSVQMRVLLTRLLGQVGDKLREVVVDEKQPAVQLVFDDYVCYFVTNESFARADPTEASVGASFRRCRASLLLEYVKKTTCACDAFPGAYLHYRIVCVDHIVDVVSTSEPIIELVS